MDLKLGGAAQAYCKGVRWSPNPLDLGMHGRMLYIECKELHDHGGRMILDCELDGTRSQMGRWRPPGTRSQLMDGDPPEQDCKCMEETLRTRPLMDEDQDTTRSLMEGDPRTRLLMDGDPQNKISNVWLKTPEQDRKGMDGDPQIRHLRTRSHIDG